MLILPGDPEFDLTLALAQPPDAPQVEANALEGVAFVADADSGLLRAVDYEQGLWDYLIGGEYQERLKQTEPDDLL